MKDLQKMTVSLNFGVIFLICTVFINKGGAVLELEGYRLFENKNCYSNDIWQGAANSEADCANRCVTDPTCVAFVYYIHQTNPPQYCYTKSVCEEASLFWVANLYTYLRLDTTTQADPTTELPTTEAATTTTLGILTTNSSGSSSTVKPFQFIPYDVSSVSEAPAEAPAATGIGVFMILLLVGFIMFFVLLDLDSYNKALKKGYRNLSRGLKRRCCCKSKKAATSDNSDTDDEAGNTDNAKEDDTTKDTIDAESKLEEVKVVPNIQLRSQQVKSAAHQEPNMSEMFTRTSTSNLSNHSRQKCKQLTKQLSRKSLVYHIEDVD